jgi:hypothetical protein
MISNTSGRGYVKPFGQVFSDKRSSNALAKERYYTIKLPETLFSALRRSPDEFVEEMRLAAAVKWYELQLVERSVTSFHRQKPPKLLALVGTLFWKRSLGSRFLRFK